MKKFLRILFGIIIVLVLVTYIPQFCHTCSDCKKFFIGAGYEPNVVAELLSSEEGILCKDCAEKQHVIGVGLGKSLDDFKKQIEYNPLTVIQEWID